MPEPKPVMLTDAEEDWITRKISTDEPTLNVAPLLHAVEDIVAAREAAARREALLEAAQWFAHEDVDAFGTSRESAQTYTVLVLADEAQRPGGPRFALAEPERDEESGR